MAQTIKLKRSSTSGAEPSTSDLELGEVAINTYDGKMFIKKNDGSDSIVELGTGGGGEASYIKTTVTATAGQTTVTGLTYTAGIVDVYLNGARLVVGQDVTATNGTSIVLAAGANLNDIIQVVAFKASEAFTPASPTFTGTVTAPIVNASTSLKIAGVTVTSTASELNLLDGVTTTAAELNILDEATVTTAELNKLDGMTSSKAELNILTGLTSTAAELNKLDGATCNTVELNTLTGLTSNTAELNLLDGVTATTLELNKLDGVTATTAELNYVDGVTSNIQTQLDALPVPKITATASGAIANGEPVLVNANGTVSAPTGSSALEGLAGSPTAHTDNGGTTGGCLYSDIAYDTTNNVYCIVYNDSGGTYKIKGKVGTFNGSAWTFGAPLDISQYQYTGSATVCFNPDTSQFIIQFVEGQTPSNGSGHLRARVATVTGTGTSASLTLGSIVDIDNRANVSNGAVSNNNWCTYDTNADRVIHQWTCRASSGVNAGEGRLRIGTVSGTGTNATISFGSTQTFHSDSTGTDRRSLIFDPDSNNFTIVYQDYTGSEYMKSISGTVDSSDNSVDLGSEVAIGTNVVGVSSGICYDTHNNKIVACIYNDGSNDVLEGYVGTSSGTGNSATVSWGAAGQITSVATTKGHSTIAYDETAKQVVVWYKDAAGNQYGKLIVGTVSGTTVSFGNGGTHGNSSSPGTALTVISGGGAIEYPTGTYDPDQKVTVFAYTDEYASPAQGAVLAWTTGFFDSNLTAENYIGIADAAYADGNTATVQIVGAVDDAQSSLTPGQKYYVQADGSLGLTAASISVPAGTAIAATKLIVKG